MRRRAALGGSIAIHVAVGVVLIAVRSQEPERALDTRHAVELVEVDPASLVELVDLSSLSSGGGAGGNLAATAGTREAANAATAATTGIARVDRRRPRRQDVVRSTPTDRSLSDSLADVATASRDHEFLDGDRVSDDDPTRAGSVGRDADGGDGRGGDSGGRGGGHGRGIGRGAGAALGDLATIGGRVPAPPPAPKASKARPAKLIYPSRDVDIDEDSELFIARVTVDRDGYVVGARLVRGYGGRKDDEAGGLIFRFRYAPALDDDGRPIKSQLDQQFLVGR